MKRNNAPIRRRKARTRGIVDALRAKYGYSEEEAIEVLQSKWLRHSTGRALDADLFKDFGYLMVNTANNPDDYMKEPKITPESHL